MTPEKVGRTDQQGRFEIEAIKEFRLSRSIIGDRYFPWTLCISANGKTYLGVFAGSVGYAPDVAKLRCVVGPESREVDSGAPAKGIREFAICTKDG